jgi:O-antigen/teichoic acid export membrane protein
MNETIAAKSSATTTWFGALFAVFQGMDKNDYAMWAGIAIAFFGMVINAGVNWYYKRKDYKLALKIAGLKDDE